MAVGNTKVACSWLTTELALIGVCANILAVTSRSIRSIWASRPRLASASITGPTSVDIRVGLPTTSSAIWPCSNSISSSATSSCTQRIRQAEQRWPAEPKADNTASLTTCSGSAVESAIIAFWPPVSAINTGSSPLAWAWLFKLWLIRWAVWVEPVKITPDSLSAWVKAAPTSPAPVTKCSALLGKPAWYISWAPKWAIKLVCSAGLATTVLPAASAATIWPV